MNKFTSKVAAAALTLVTIEGLVKKNISTLGENIQIRRFERFVLGEGLEKKNENFSDEVEKMMKKD